MVVVWVQIPYAVLCRCLKETEFGGLRNGCDCCIGIPQRGAIHPSHFALVNKDSKVLLQFLIDSFRLSVTLRVVSGGSCQFNSEESVKFPGKFRYKLRAMIG